MTSSYLEQINKKYTGHGITFLYILWFFASPMVRGPPQRPNRCQPASQVRGPNKVFLHPSDFFANTMEKNRTDCNFPISPSNFFQCLKNRTDEKNIRFFSRERSLRAYLIIVRNFNFHAYQKYCVNFVL
jgi:hypothetical protein